MPTTQVGPGSEPLLQDIANSLWKSRKVVVITGAGISTNSGIPDFRSENGLYSLIQAQFDAVAANEASRTTNSSSSSSNVDLDESNTSFETADERPTKRRRLSRHDGETIAPRPMDDGHPVDSAPVQAASEQMEMEGETRAPAENTEAAQASPQKPAGEVPKLPALTTTLEFGAPSSSNLEESQDVAMQDVEGLEPPAVDVSQVEQPPGPTDVSGLVRGSAGLTPLSSPPHPPQQPVTFSLTSPAREPPTHFLSSPPHLTLDSPRLQSIPDQSFSRRMSSSPLSSPPPTLFNPYPESTSTPFDSSSEQSSCSSSRSESEEPSSASTPLLTSQSSFGSSSGRNSLPNIKGRDLFDSQIWSCPTKTSVFYTFATTLRQKVRHATPTSSHHFVSVLRDSRKLVRCYTQNIDQLEERVGLSTSLSLGAGSRYRFSARAGRQSAGVRNMARQDAPEAPVQGESQEGGQEDCQEAQEHLQGEEKARAVPAAVPGPPAAPSHLGDDRDRADVGDGGDPPASADLGGCPSDSQQRVLGSAPSSAVLARGPSLTTSTPTPPNRGVECVFLHGSLAELRCFVCGRTSSWDEDSRQSDTLAGRQPTCPHCAGATAAREERGKRALGVGKLRPDIVLYGEEHPHAHLISPIIQHDLSLGPDMLLILGTSMRVHGLKVLVKEFAKAVHDRGGKVVFVNFTKPPDSVWADVLDYWVQWDCDAWVGDLQHRKPALFLPPGTVLPEDEKKLARASRRTSGGDSAKQKSGSTNKRRETGGKGQRDSSGSSITVIEDGIEAAELPSSEVMPPPRSSRARKDGKEPGEPREPKLNPNAKRPASIRDHKLNGAYLVWKIMGELRRVTGGAIDPSDASSANETKPKAAPRTRRSRRSAPAALEPEDKDATADTSAVMPEPENEPKEEIAEPETAVSEEVESEVKDEPMHDATQDSQDSQQDSPKESMQEQPQQEEAPQESLLEAPQESVHEAPQDSTPEAPQPVTVNDDPPSDHPPIPVTIPTEVATQPIVPIVKETKATGTDDHDTSILALVKSRKRKRTAWKMVRGVETRVPIEDDPDEVPPLPHTDAAFKPCATPNPVPEDDAAPQPQVISTSSLPVEEAAALKPAATATPKTKPRKQAKPKPKLDALPRTEAVFKPKAAAPSTPLSMKPEPKPKPRALPKSMSLTMTTTPATSKPTSRVATPIPTPVLVTTRPPPLKLPEDGFSETDRLIAKLNGSDDAITTPTTTSAPIGPSTPSLPPSHPSWHAPPQNDGFQETDRLIARYNELASESRPVTPVHLPPIKTATATANASRRCGLTTTTNMNTTQTHHGRPEPLEPKVTSPGPMAEIAPDVGSPVAVRNNPFSYADPLGRQLSFPPTWLGSGSGPGVNGGSEVHGGELHVGSGFHPEQQHYQQQQHYQDQHEQQYQGYDQGYEHHGHGFHQPTEQVGMRLQTAMQMQMDGGGQHQNGYGYPAGPYIPGEHATQVPGGRVIGDGRPHSHGFDGVASQYMSREISREGHGYDGYVGPFHGGHGYGQYPEGHGYNGDHNRTGYDAGQSDEASAAAAAAAVGGGGGFAGPEEQLQKEQEAAMMLSLLRGGGGC